MIPWGARGRVLRVDGNVIYDINVDPTLKSTRSGSAITIALNKFNSGPTANRPSNPEVGTPYFDTTILCLVVWNGTAWQLPVRPGYADLVGSFATAAGAGGLTSEAYLDTPKLAWYFSRTVAQSLSLDYQMPHDWDGGAIEHHWHVAGAATTAGDVVFGGRYCWSSTAGSLVKPAWASWTTFKITKTIAATQGLPDVISTGLITPPAAAQYPSAFFHVYVQRLPADPADTYEGSKVGGGQAANNLELEGVDCHVMRTGLGTAGLYS